MNSLITILKSTKIKISSISLIFVSFLSAVLSGVSTAFAAPVAVPVTAELIVELLVALGVLSGSAAAGGYVLSQDVDPYTATIFQNQVSALTYDVPISEETIEQAGLLGSVIPDGLYTYDGTNFGLSGSSKELTFSDTYLTAKSLIGVSYSMPVNVNGANYVSGQAQGSSNPVFFSSPVTYGSVATDTYYLPFFTTKSGAFVYPLAINFPSVSEYSIYRIKAKSVDSGNLSRTIMSRLLFAVQSNIPRGTVPFATSNESNPSNGEYFGLVPLFPDDRDCIRVSGSGSNSFGFSAVIDSICLTLDGVPSYELSGESDKLEGALVQVKKDDDDNNGGTPPAPQSPNNWELWRTLQDLEMFLDNGTVSNGGTSFQDYVNNNYNYVDVDINVPDTIHNDVNLSGGLDINGQGDLNITVHEDISLPSAGDGSGFYNPNAADVVAALSDDNPVFSSLKGLFSVIDPHLLAIFSISISLTFVLGLWKLIRG